MAKISMATVKDTVRRIGRELTVRCTLGEYRVSIAIPAIQMINDCDYATAKERNEALAAYCSDAQEAIDTAAMLHNYYLSNRTI